MIDISVIIVNYNVRDLLENCINSVLAASSRLKVEIVVVDNNSFDGSAEHIRSKFSSNPSVKLIENKVNLGFAKANNLGVKYTSGKFLLILNPDTILQEDTLEKTLSFYDRDDLIAAVTCKLVLPNGKLDLACRRSFPSTSVALYRMLGLSRVFPKSKIFGKYNLTYLDENESYEVDSICGAFMLIRKDIYDKVGGFDEEYFMFGEDLDLCYRIKRAGYKIFYYSGSSTIHYKGESTRKSSLSYVNNFYGAMGIFAKKNLHKDFALMKLIVKVLIFTRSAFSYLKRVLKFSYPALLDILLILLSMLISIKVRFEFFPIEAYSIVIIIYSLIWLFSLSLTGAYKRENILSISKPLLGILMGFFINSSFTYFFNDFAFSRAVVLRTTAYSFLVLAAWRLIIKVVNYSKQKNIFFTEGNTVIVGRNEETERFMNKMKRRVDTDYNILGYISVIGTDFKNGYIGNLNNLNDIITVARVKNVIFAKDELSNQQILDMMWSLRNQNLYFKIITSDRDIILGKSQLDKIDDIYLMQIEYNINKKINIFVKRIFDLVLALVFMIFVYPFVLLNLRVFDTDQQHHKFLKKILLIPKVIKGSLSFVGRATWDTASAGKQFVGKNGLTGLVQINYYKNLSREEIDYYNFYYAKNQSLALDLEIMLKTISLYFFRKKIIQL